MVLASLRHSMVPSRPMVRSSSPTQVLIADGVSVHGLVQPISVFSKDIGGKKAPALTDQFGELKIAVPFAIAKLAESALHPGLLVAGYYGAKIDIAVEMEFDRV